MSTYLSPENTRIVIIFTLRISESIIGAFLLLSSSSCNGKGRRFVSQEKRNPRSNEKKREMYFLHQSSCCCRWFMTILWCKKVLLQFSWLSITIECFLWVKLSLWFWAVSGRVSSCCCSLHQFVLSLFSPSLEVTCHLMLLQVMLLQVMLLQGMLLQGMLLQDCCLPCHPSTCRPRIFSSWRIILVSPQVCLSSVLLLHLLLEKLHIWG